MGMLPRAREHAHTIHEGEPRMIPTPTRAGACPYDPRGRAAHDPHAHARGSMPGSSGKFPPEEKPNTKGTRREYETETETEAEAEAETETAKESSGDKAGHRETSRPHGRNRPRWIVDGSWNHRWTSQTDHGHRRRITDIGDGSRTSETDHGHRRRITDNADESRTSGRRNKTAGMFV
jgi:hypothetical protein